jgi:hypothetical protein
MYAGTLNSTEVGVLYYLHHHPQQQQQQQLFFQENLSSNL